jgi:hypothetical protein
MISLRKDFKNDIKNRLKSILKYNYRCVLIANTFINLNRSFGENYLTVNKLLILKIERSKY